MTTNDQAKDDMRKARDQALAALRQAKSARKQSRAVVEIAKKALSRAQYDDIQSEIVEDEARNAYFKAQAAYIQDTRDRRGKSQ